MSLKILSDFDGVWTDPAHEAAQVRSLFVRELGRLAGIDLEEAEAEVGAIQETVLAAPEKYGWCVRGQLTAYVDEDPFCLPNTVGSVLGSSGDTRHVRLREAVLAGGHASTEDFANHCFFEASTSYRRDHPPALVDGACEVYEALMELGVELVVVSNSPPEKIEGWFGAVGARIDHDRFRVRGKAGKHELADEPETLQAAGRTVRVDRPLYRRVLEEEAPDLVIGDVFSLDLALPYWLEAKGLAGGTDTTILRRQAHTPAWTAEIPGLDHVDDVAQLVGIAESRAR